jgi:hypothetical protein
MGLLSGVYDAKTGGGFQAGGMSLHNVMAGHGPDADAHDKVPPPFPLQQTDSLGFECGIETSKDYDGKYGVHVWYVPPFLLEGQCVDCRIVVDVGS